MGKILEKYKSKRIYIFAYKELNLGDDLFMIRLIKRYPETKFVMISDRRYHSLLMPYKNIVVYDKFSLFLKCLQKIHLYEKWKQKIINFCDYAVYIGGSIFMEYERWKEQYQWYQNLFDNKRLFFIGCNWGPCRTEQFYHNMKNVLSNMKDICFRDVVSYNAFSELNNVRYAPDILLGTCFQEYSSKKQVFISVIDCCSKEEGGHTLKQYESNYLLNLKIMILFYISKGYNIKLVSFCEKERDLLAIKKLYNMLDKQIEKHVSILSYNGDNLDVIMREMKSSKLVIGSRFHAVILALAANVKVFPMIYSDKTLHVLNDLDYEGPYIDIRKSEKINIQELYSSLLRWRRPDKLSMYIKESDKHFLVLDKILNKE